MGKTWLFVNEYVDAETGEYLYKNKEEIKNKYTKQKYSEKIEYRGKNNIRKTTWIVRERPEQQTIW